jgi:hypothetical protein
MQRHDSTARLASIDRRRFLGAVAGAAAGVPFLRAFPLAAAPGALPKLILLAGPNGPLVGPRGNPRLGYGGWRPQGVKGQGDEPITGALSPIHEPLAPFRENLLFIENLSCAQSQTDPHASTASIITGRPRSSTSRSAYSSTGISIDQFLGQELQTTVLNTAWRYVAAKAEGDSYWCFSGPGRPVRPIEDPLETYAQVFANATPVAGQGSAGAAEWLARRRSVLDQIARDVNAMKARVPAADRPRLEAHLDGIRAVERQLSVTPAASCKATGTPGPAGTHRAPDQMPRVIEQHSDIIVQALACGSSRVATIQMGAFGGAYQVPWVPGAGRYTEHAISHKFSGMDGAGSNGLEQSTAIGLGVAKERGFSSHLAHLLDRLKNTTDSDGRPMLENTLVAYLRPNGTNHDHNRTLWIIAGGSGVGVRGGRYLRVADPQGSPAPAEQLRYTNDVLVSMCHAMGVRVASFGDPRFNKQTIALS